MISPMLLLGFLLCGYLLGVLGVSSVWLGVGGVAYDHHTMLKPGCQYRVVKALPSSLEGAVLTVVGS